MSKAADEIRFTFHLTPSHLIVFLYVLGVVIVGAMQISAPLPVLLDYFIPDDAFYYFNTARIFARTGFSSFDGLHFTNGYQPLWFALSVPIFWVFPEGGELPLRWLLLVQLLFAAGATGLLAWILTRLFGLVAGGLGLIVWIVVMQRTLLNGLEVPLFMLLYALVLIVFLRLHKSPNTSFLPGQLLLLGILSGLIFLARTDAAFLVAGLAIYILLYRREDAPRERIKRFLSFAIPAGLIAGSYLAMNLWQTGHLMPVSGAAKQYHSAVVRQAAIQQTGDTLQVYLQNLIWPFTGGRYRFISIGLTMPWLLTGLALFKPWRASLRPVARLWPFYLGALLAFLFYSVSFYGGFTRTTWYYSPHTFLTCLSLAAVASLAQKYFPFNRMPALLPVILVGFCLYWLTWKGLAYFGVGLLLFILVQRLPGWPPKVQPVVKIVTLCFMLIIVWGVFAWRGINASAWLVIAAAIIALQALILPESPPQYYTAVATALIVSSAFAIHTLGVRSVLTAEPKHWNYNLYQGALWARDHLPPEATIWSGSAGILGYFSGHIVVNTDGLANSYEFLENVLKQGRLHDYYRQWDYVIDAFPVDAHPDWVPVTLPPEFQQLGFQDGALVRKLRVFQTNAQAPSPR